MATNISCPHCGKDIDDEIIQSNEHLKKVQELTRRILNRALEESGYEGADAREHHAEYLYRVHDMSDNEIETELRTFDMGYEMLFDDIEDIKSVKNESDLEKKINVILSQNSEKRAKEMPSIKKNADKLYYAISGIDAARKDLKSLLSE